MKDSFEVSLLESGELVGRGLKAMINNIGRVTAVITLAVVSLVLFCNVSFEGISGASFTSTMLVLLFASYLMYFSMEDAGERLGESSEEYKTALSRHREKSSKIQGKDLPKFREFLTLYAKEELNYRRSSLLLGYGYSLSDYDKFKSGELFPKNASRIFKKADRLRAKELSPKTIIESHSSTGRGELENPEKTKLLGMLVKLLPTTLYMTVTVSVALSAKTPLSFATVADALFKLSALLIIGFKGYSAGYLYAKKALPVWLDSKSRIIDAFLA